MQLVNIFILISGKLSSLDDLGDIPFPVTYYTLSEKDLEDNGYSFNLPGYLLSLFSKM
jgi:RNA exonuclease 1